MQQGASFGAVAPLTKVVKALLIVNITTWVGLVLILQRFILGGDVVFQYFGLIPEKLILSFWVWQPVSYMFLHSTQIFHVLFNMLILWWFGSELEMRWGPRFFLLYYFVCGVGAAFMYSFTLFIYALISGNSLPMVIPVVGASGAIFGLLLAYGLLFGDRIIHFMMLFPMKARYFVMIVGVIELLSVMDSGVGGPVANLAHLSGLLVGFLFLLGYSHWQRFKREGGIRGSRRGRRLKLVVNNNTSDDERRNPRYWN